MIFITIFLFVAILTLIQYFGLQGYLNMILYLPVEFYLVILALLLVFRTGRAIIKFFPAIKGFFKSLSRISSKIDNLSNKLDKTNDSNPFKGGQKRDYSTLKGENRKKLLSNPLPIGRRSDSKTIAHANLPKMSKHAQLLSSRRIQGLFASIVENGSLVSLASTWTRVGEFVSEAAIKIAISQLPSKDLLTKVNRSKKGNYQLFYQSKGSLADLMSAFGWRIISLAFPQKVKFVGRLRLLAGFSKYIWRIYQCHGSQQVVKFLKAGQLAIQKFIGKDHIDSLRELDKDLVRSRLSSRGLPTIIPSRDARLIEAGAAPVIRFWLTLFSVYRVISIPGTLKLGTIISPSDVQEKVFAEVAETFNDFLRSTNISSMFNKKILEKEADIMLFEAASATQKVAWTGLFSDPILLEHLGDAVYLRKILVLLNQQKLLRFFDSLAGFGLGRILYDAPHLRERLIDLKGEECKDNPYSHSIIADPEGSYSGKLSLKEEAAGKIRVFAMTDIWTQTVLKPIESMLARFLKDLPNDGVYDQTASELRARSKSITYGCSYGYDLSAATDRLPLALQEMVLNQIVPNLGTFWGPFLTRRAYYLYLPTDFAKEIGADSSTIRAKAPNSTIINGIEVPIYYNSKKKPWVRLHYAVGQPMGALSSFAMLAVTHHLIAQLAYRVAYQVPDSTPWSRDTWYTGYECTGDDIIFFDKLVAEEYLSLMTDIGVPINTTKSVIAKVACTEYLKVTSLNGVNVGAISWKMLMSGNSLMGRANILFFFLSKGIINKNIMPWIERSARPTLHKPGNLTPTLIAMWTMLSNRGLITVDDALKGLINGKVPLFRWAKAILLNANTDLISKSLPSIFRTGVYNYVPDHNVDYLWSFEKPWFEHAMYSPIAVFVAKTKPEEDNTALTGSMFSVLLRDFGLQKGSWDIEKVMQSGHVTDFDSSELEFEIQTLFSCLLSYMEGKLGHISDRIINSGADWGRTSTSELAKLNDDLDRYKELLEIVSRYQDKIDPDKDITPPRNIKPTELRLIKLIRRLGNRPLFTTALNRGEERGNKFIQQLRTLNTNG